MSAPQVQLHGEDSTLRGVGIPHGQLQEPETLAKVLPAGGPLLGREMCPLCEHAPAEPRDNPFRSCRACGYRAP